MTELERCIAANVRRLRVERGWSVRDLAKLARLSTRTIMNVEQGAASSFQTQQKLVDALQTTLESLCKPTLADDRQWQIVRGDECRWYFALGSEADRHHRRYAHGSAKRERIGYERCPDSVQSARERFRLGMNGQASGFFQERSGQLCSGGYKVRVVEVFGSFEIAPDPHRLTIQIHVLQGDVLVEESEEPTTLQRGDTLIYVAREPLVLRPSSAVSSLESVPTVLLTRLAMFGPNHREFRRRRAIGADGEKPATKTSDAQE